MLLLHAPRCSTRVLLNALNGRARCEHTCRPKTRQERLQQLAAQADAARARTATAESGSTAGTGTGTGTGTGASEQQGGAAGLQPPWPVETLLEHLR